MLPAGEVRLTVSGTSDTGSIRAVNEDSFIAEFPLFLVADGMGGHARGDQASQTAAATLRSHLVGETLPTPAQVLTAISAANDAVIALSAESGDQKLSGTTIAGVVAVLTTDGHSAHWMAFNVGDSRIYSWNGRHLEQLSVDHSAVQELVDAGLLTDAAAREHPDRNVITRAIGAQLDVDADVWLLPISSAQTFLLCSDGLTKELDDDEIALQLSAHGAAPSSSNISETLVEAAINAGGRDNVTVVVVASSLEGAEVDTENTNERGMRMRDLEDTTPRA
jgi:serine/threonine protein phosphatase PrpC